MPVKPIPNHIADEIYARLQSLHGESIAGVAMSVVRSLARGTSPKHGQISLQYGGNVNNEAFDVPGNPFREGRTQTFYIAVSIRDEASDEQTQSLAWEVYTQVKYKIHNSGSASWYAFRHNLGDEITPNYQNLAVDARVGDFEPIEPDGGLGGIRIPLEVHYRTPEQSLDTVG